MAFLISKESLEELYEHGVKGYPEEVCGFILLDESIYKAVNIQNELNKKSFETYSRTAKNGYTMSVHDTRMLDILDYKRVGVHSRT